MAGRGRSATINAMNVEQIMTTEVLTVDPGASLRDVAELLVQHRIAGLPVCNDQGEVLGVVSEGDILWKETGLAVKSNRLLERILDLADGEEKRLEARTAGEAMSSPAITISPLAPVSQAAKLMIDRRVNRLPVIRDGNLVGIVARSDLVRAFIRSDGTIQREIADDVLLRTLWVDPDSLTLVVDDGEVTISGRVDNRTTAELIETYIRRIPGVVGVTPRLTWTIDDLAKRTAATARVPHTL